ncbi:MULTISPECIES: Wadjet anti-phage system protein JetD domain-containing protein [unclassified Pseudomonas]|uniref:Wadjet anti-phage system protein JetD domain-containing protein n=1 Tax=unclassified Pseudomonas TaxID=196821 RepID=UPI00128B223A|nr:MULTISPECIES: Wadjet anti-phage system protein JetD domain-containing protein [unclassified Pseudomonas]
MKNQLERQWARGELLRALVRGTPLFPMALKLKGPSSRELTQQFEAVRNWVSQLNAITSVRIEWRDVRHPVMGQQRLPQSVWIDQADTAIAWLGKRPEVSRFMAIQAETRARQPALLEWLVKSPLRALKLSDEWSRLLDVVQWLQEHPTPRLYLRQVDLAGIHTKFIEAHQNVLSELFELALPEQHIALNVAAGRFTARYGFLEKPVRIRLRLLDASIPLIPGVSYPDITLDTNSFSSLDLKVRQIFITENEINFLAFPPVPNAIVIFGSGYGWEALAQAQWLNHCTLHYWGDIDTHGFAILNQLRGKFAHVESFLMDRATLMAHQALWGDEEKQATHDLTRLTHAERLLFDELRDNRIRPRLRLEQERVGFHWVQAALISMETSTPN